VVVWRRELSASEPFGSLVPDPLDARRLAACGAQGGLAVITLRGAQTDAVDIKTYKVAVGGAPGASGAPVL
jgi:hypothetical protein